MSYRCQGACKAAFPNDDYPVEFSPNRVVTKVRPRMDGSIFRGHEIAEEKNLCKRCAATKVEPTVVAARKVAPQAEPPVFARRDDDRRDRSYDRN